MAKQKTPEELKREQSAQEYLRKREKLKSQGMTEKNAMRALVPEEETKLKETIAEREGLQKQKQQEQLQESVTAPLPTSENIPTNAFQFGTDQIDVFGAKGGGIIEAIGNTHLGQAMASKAALETEDVNKIIELSAKMREQGLTPEQVSTDPLVQNLLKLQLTDLDAQVISDGQAAVTGFQQKVESIPVVGKLATQYISGLQTPSQKVKTTLNEIEEIDRRVTEWDSAANNNPAMAQEYLRLMNDTEQEMLYLQSKLKLLSIQSPILQANPEEISRIERRIEGTLIKINSSRNKIILGTGVTL